MQWHDIQDPNDPELERLAAQYSIHPLHIEDCHKRDQRAKVEDSPGYLFTVFKTISMREGCALESHDLDLFLGHDWLITVREGNQDEVEKLLKPVHAVESELRADQAFHRVADGVVDSYLPGLDRIDDVIDDLLEQVLDNATPQLLARIFSTKRDLIELRRILVNTRDLCAHLYRAESEFLPAELMPFLRDVYDHVSRNLDLVETQRDLLTATMDVYLSSVANRTNQVMKVLTILGTIALPVLVISGFYGMNTKGLPFSDSPHATVVVAAMMGLSTVILLGLLRWFRWF